MNAAVPACIECGARLEQDQEYCLECGARQGPPPGPEWRRAVIAAAVTVALAALVLAFGYQQMRDDADSEAASQAGRGAAVKQAAASGPEDRSGNRKQAPPAPLAAGRSP